MPPENPAWTTERLLQWAVADFRTRGITDARLSAELLLARALGTNRVGLFLKFDRPVGDEEKKSFRDFVEQRRGGKPVAYILGEKEFYSMPFRVDPRVLIPRPETEILVDEVLDHARGKSSGIARVLDVGTGSGAIAIALKKHLPEAGVTGIDVSPDALELARSNAELNRVDVDFRVGNLLTGVDGPLDVVVANLPYIPREECLRLPVDVRDYEPRIALDGGITGLDLIAELVAQASERVGDGALFLEIGAGQRDEVARLLGEAGFRADRIRADLAGIPRVVRAIRE
jgi:release factor glutamine methyltransferase